jgi:hypothetical protein
MSVSIHLRLVVEHKLLLLQPASQCGFQLGACGNGLLHFRVEKAQGIATGALA